MAALSETLQLVMTKEKRHHKSESAEACAYGRIRCYGTHTMPQLGSLKQSTCNHNAFHHLVASSSIGRLLLHPTYTLVGPRSAPVNRPPAVCARPDDGALSIAAVTLVRFPPSTVTQPTKRLPFAADHSWARGLRRRREPTETWAKGPSLTRSSVPRASQAAFVPSCSSAVMAAVLLPKISLEGQCRHTRWH